jgi:hypothetical protein
MPHRLFLREVVMHRYELVSAVLFSIIALAQLTRTVLGWPVQVDGFSVPIWVSGIAFIVAASFAIWGLRSARATPNAG